MNNFDFKISNKLVWALVIGYILFAIVGTIFKIQHKECSQLIFTGVIIFYFSTWIIVFNDIIINKIFNKTFWIMSMFIFSPVSPIFYLILRNKLIRLGNKFNKTIN